METIKFVANKVRPQRNMNNKKLSTSEICLINSINLILEVIITGSVKFNKLTSAEEIQEKLFAYINEGSPDKHGCKDLDIEAIKFICDAFCVEKGVLIKMKKNNECYYKLNHLENV
jgi:hypothetical protein